MPTRTHSDYMVGWICALPVEGAAAVAMLDERHAQLSQHPADNNSYYLGRIGHHNVVIACLPAGQTGAHNAAIVAAHMRYSFDSIKVNLMVGIGGGIPSKQNDIRLGDVVVSKPGLGSGGVVQYDFGKTVEAGKFIQTHSVDSTDPALLSALSAMQISSFVDGNLFPQYLSEIPTLMQVEFSFPGAEQDQLFEADYDHLGGATCERCDPGRLVIRNPRPSTTPMVFYGTIVSGNQVMKHGATRDKLGREFDALCFEMEAAGLMSHFRCAVIRGISDYADSHKNKQWQPYAALTAAAYAKELLGITPPSSFTPIPTTLSPLPTPGAIRPPVLEMEKPTVMQLTGISTSSFFVFNPVLLPLTSVTLGRLVINTRAPWEDFCPYVPQVDERDMFTVTQSRIREMVESARGTELYERLSTRFSFFIGERVSVLGSALERTYLLLNSGPWFKNVCADPKTREWLEKAIEHEWSVYMAVGIHTVKESAMVGMEDRLQQMQLITGTDRTTISAAPTELIIAVQYRKVHYDWHSSQKVESAFLEVACNRWEVYASSRTAEFDEEEEDIVEATLKDAIDKEDVKEEGEIYVLDTQMIVL